MKSTATDSPAAVFVGRKIEAAGRSAAEGALGQLRLGGFANSIGQLRKQGNSPR